MKSDNIDENVNVVHMMIIIVALWYFRFGSITMK